ncbi:rod-binding protein [Roseburia sp. MSJ-14]|uniref:rod-binding protein n=1 Tax=Roseburia sp. MSJ-14 TaxID=2841514 RepID=UPI001C10B0DD|nr:rod-binding protein [Roseburia sp. MSJ-14]MBU5474570.1 rod-binding protein [Roseburia sp. MSJ-14]
MSLSIDNISALYNTNNVSENTSKLEETLKSDFSNASDDELMEVCKDFESYFTEQMFKAMQKMIPESDDDTSSYTKQIQDYYKEQMVQVMAENSTEGQGLGIAQTLYEQMKRNYNL